VARDPDQTGVARDVRPQLRQSVVYLANRLAWTGLNG
jgi:hypothetical protein